MSAWKASFFSWWSSISQREQRMLIVCSFLLLLFGIYWGVIQPISEQKKAAEISVNNEQQLLRWVSDKADHIVELRSLGGISTSNEPFNQVISTSSKSYNIELIRIQPRDEMLQVWIKPVKFDQLIHWLAFLQQKKGVQVEFMDISESDIEGMVEVKRLQLKRGS